jgi:predicted nucleic acid-binding Zn ribbon protein
MPTYVYKFVKTGETIEVQQSFNEPTLTTAVHPRSGRKMAVKKVFTPVGVTFRGDGFYRTDSRAKTSTSKSTDDTKSDSSSKTDKSDKSDKSDKTGDPTSKKAKPEAATASAP